MTMSWAAGLLAVSTLVAAQDSTPFPAATPESQGMSSAALAELAGVVRGFVEADLAVGAELLVVKNRRTVLHESFGWRDREDEVPLGHDTVFNIRSMTKTLTGAAAQILIDRGQLALDDKVAKYIPGFDNEDAREVTVRQLLTHASGLPVTVVAMNTNYDRLLAIGNEAGERGPYFEPDSKFWYSDAGADTLGAVVEVASGMVLDEFIRAEILEPLGMADSSWPHEGRLDPPRVASLYFQGRDGWSRVWKPGDSFLYRFAWGSQSLYSTPTDYAKFLAMWMDEGAAGERRILSPAAVARTLTPVWRTMGIGNDDPYPTGYEALAPYYGQMAMVHVDAAGPRKSSPAIIGHGGSDGTNAWAWPDRDLMVLCFTQSRGGAAVLLLESYIDYLLLHPERQTASTAHFDPYVGTYARPTVDGESAPFIVRILNGHLALDIPGQPFPFELHDADDEGRWQFRIDSRVAVSFPAGEGGAFDTMLLHEPDGTGAPLLRVVEPPPLSAETELRLERLVTRLEEQRVERHIPGMALAVVQGDRVLMTHGFGVRDVDTKVPVTPDTIFAIGSATKPFTATLVGMLVDDGAMTFDDPVTKHLPWFQLAIDSDDPDAEVTLRDMLSHRTGFTRMGALVRSPGVPWETVLRTAMLAEPWAPFRKEWNYTNVMYLAAGVAAAEAVGSTWEAIIEERIFAPLGMTSSFTSVPSPAASGDRFAPGYTWDPIEEVLERQALPNVAGLPPAGAIHSTAADMANWLRFQLRRGEFAGQRLLEPETHAETWRAQIAIGPGMGYGLGWGVEEWDGQLLIEHGGNVEGFAAHVAMLPESDLGYVLLTNTTVTALTRLSMDMVWDAMLGDEPAAVANAGASPLAPYVGTYHATLRDEEVEILEEDGHLVFQAALGKFALREPDAEGRWCFAVSPAMAISFTHSADDEVIVLNLHQGPMTFECIREGAELPSEVDDLLVAPYLGSYYSERMHETLEVLVQNGRLAVRIPGQGVFELMRPNDEGHWAFRMSAGTSLTFRSDDTGAVTSLTYHEGPGTLVYDRVAAAESDLPTVDEVLAPRLTAARRAAREQLGVYRLTGTVRMVHSGVTGKLTWYAVGNDRHGQANDMGVFGTNRAAFDGSSGWTLVPPNTRREETGRMGTQLREAHPTAWFGDPRDFYASVRVQPPTEFEGRTVNVLEVGNEGMPTRRFLLDPDTADLLAEERTVLSGSGMPALSLLVRYEDHREVHGLRVPFRSVAIHSAIGRIVTQIEGMEIGLEEAPAMFRIEDPAGR